MRFKKLLLLAALLTILPILICCFTDLPLGQPDKFVYRYSPFKTLRSMFVFIPVLLGVLLAACAMVVDGAQVLKRQIALAFSILTLGLLFVWNFLAPPGDVLVHAFNFESLSHDGAFELETTIMPSVPEYLKAFDQRIQFSEKEMRSTRIISNPPGMTIFLYTAHELLPIDPARPDWRQEIFRNEYMTEPELVSVMAARFTAGFAVAILHLLAIPFFYLLGRAYFSRAASIAFASFVLFNPATLHFFPGKDTLHLVTIGVMLWGWFASFRSRQWWPSAVAGIALAIGLSIGLIHAWIAIAVFVALLWQSSRDRQAKSFLLNQFLPTLAGIGLVQLAFWWTLEWNLLKTLWAVQARYRELQPTLGFNRPLWLVIGLPIFLMFVGPIVWFLGLRNWRHRHLSLGGRLAIATLGVMTLTYIVGIAYELPRLWIAFFPLLILSGMLMRPLFKPLPLKKARLAIASLILLNLTASSIHWIFLDAREAEYRIVTKRFFH